MAAQRLAFEANELELTPRMLAALLLAPPTRTKRQDGDWEKAFFTFDRRLHGSIAPQAFRDVCAALGCLLTRAEVQQAFAQAGCERADPADFRSLALLLPAPVFAVADAFKSPAGLMALEPALAAWVKLLPGFDRDAVAKVFAAARQEAVQEPQLDFFAFLEVGLRGTGRNDEDRLEEVAVRLQGLAEEPQSHHPWRHLRLATGLSSANLADSPGRATARVRSMRRNLFSRNLAHLCDRSEGKWEELLGRAAARFLDPGSKEADTAWVAELLARTSTQEPERRTRFLLDGLGPRRLQRAATECPVAGADVARWRHSAPASALRLRLPSSPV